MKKIKRFRSVDLFVDVVDYIFVEWLVRHGIFTAFEANYKRFNPGNESFRSTLRTLLLCEVVNCNFSLKYLFAKFFPFKDAPEGLKFWTRHCSDWVRFCNYFCAKF